MKKPIDFDAIFDEKLAEYMEKNAGKYTEKQWESIIPKLYKSFGDTFLKSIGATPKEYFSAMTDDELVSLFQSHFLAGVSLPDFLSSELEKRDCPDGLLPLITAGGEIAVAAANIAGDNEKAFDAYFTVLTEGADEDLKETVTEALKSKADLAKERALAFYEKGVEREYMLEILSRVKEKDDRVFDVLLKEFRTSTDDLPMHASYLATYGDARALPVLLEYIDRDEINFLEYQELKYAIEALGGEYTRIRDFSDDAYFKEVQEQSAVAFDLPDKKSDA